MFSGLEKWDKSCILDLSHHINDVIKNGNRLTRYIIDGRNDYQRVYYGDLLWKTLVIPTINYVSDASSVRVPGSAIDSKRIESLQYKKGPSNP